jgi:hypothetical protein
MVCTPRICSIHGDLVSNIPILQVLATNKSNCMVDGGSNVCVTEDLGILLDVIDINPVTILVAINGGPLSSDVCITKLRLLPLTLADGSTYYQMCFYCASMVETIISPAAILTAMMSLSDGIKKATKVPVSLAAFCENHCEDHCLSVGEGHHQCPKDADNQVF